MTPSAYTPTFVAGIAGKTRRDVVGGVLLDVVVVLGLISSGAAAV